MCILVCVGGGIRPNGLLASGSEDCTVRLWSVPSGEPKEVLEGHTDGVYCLAYLKRPRQALLASGSDREIRLWQMPTGELVASMKDHQSYVWSLCACDRGLVSASADRTLKLWCTDREERNAFTPISTLEGHRDSIYTVVPLPDGQTLASGSADTDIRVWIRPALHYISQVTLKGHTKMVYSIVALSQAYIASASHDWSIRVWGVEAGTCLRKFEGHGGEVTSLAAFSDLPVLFSGARDCDCRIWDLQDSRCLRTLTGHRDEVLGVAVLATGDDDGLSSRTAVVATGSEDATIRIW